MQVQYGFLWNGWKEAEYALAYSEMLGLKLKKVAESENSYNSFNGDPGNFMNYFSVNWLFGFMCLLCVLCLSVLLLQTGFKKRNLTSHWEIWQREEDTGAVTRQEAPRSCTCVFQSTCWQFFFFLIIVIEILSYCQGHSVCQIKMRLIRSQPQDFDGAMELHNILDLEIIKGITFICICVNTFPEFGHFFFFYQLLQYVRIQVSVFVLLRCRALKLCGSGGPPHLKLVIEWDHKTKEW